MVVFLALFIFVCFYKVQFKPTQGDKYITDYMSIEKTNSIKGIFIVIVFFSHFNQYANFVHPWDITYNEIYSNIGQRMVTLFLFCSGFGVMESIRKKGDRYIHNIPKTRVLGTLFRFDIALLFYIALKYMIDINYHMSLKHLLLSLIAWDSVGNSNWYIFVIVLCYIFTFIAFEIGKSRLNYIPSLVLVTLLTLAYICFMLYFNVNYPHGIIHKQGTRWYNTAICYPLGMIYSMIRPYIEKIVNKYFIIWLVLFAGLFVVERMTYYHYKEVDNKYLSFAVYTVAIVVFVALVLLFTMKVSLNNWILRFCGKHLFGIYIMMRIPMIFFKEIINISNHTYIYFSVCAVCTVPLAYLLDTYTDKAWKLITSGGKKKEVKA